MKCNDKSLKTAMEIRRFNRFYLPYFHLLAQKYLNTEYSMAEARILYEVYENRKISARDIVNALHIDKGYVSRILKKFQAQGLLKREPSVGDMRLTLISLTEEGTALAERLIDTSNCQTEQYIAGLSDGDLDRLSYHMAQITKILRGVQDGNS